MPFADTFLEIAAILSLATVLGVLGRKLRQPLIIMFLVAGILAAQTLAEARFRQKHGVTVVGIRRGKEKITTPAPTEKRVPDDRLIVIGHSRAVAALNENKTL